MLTPPPCLTEERALEIYTEPFRRVMEYITLCNVQGAIAEFGTFRGFTARLFASMMPNDARQLWLYDSWMGFPPITNIVDTSCKEVKDGYWKAGDCKVNESVPDLIRNSIEAIIPGRLAMVRGFYSRSMQLPPSIALLHIDCDLYESTRVVLDTVRSRLSDGAVILFDDFNNNLASNNYGERRAFLETIAPDCEQWFSYGWSGYAFIYHKESYHGMGVADI